MIFTPGEPLELATSYVVSIAAGVEDLAGNRMTEPPDPFTFETTGPPEVVESEPADGDTDVALEAPIELRFSTLMDTASVEAALRLRPAFAHEVRWSGQLLEIVPTEPLRPEADYTVEIGEDAFDVSGVALGGPFRIGFRTVAPGLERSLLVPSDGTDGIAPTSPIAVIFDRPIDPDSLSDDVLTLTPAVAGSIELVDELGDDARRHPRTAACCASRPPVRCRPTRPSRSCWPRASPAWAAAGWPSPSRGPSPPARRPQRSRTRSPSSPIAPASRTCGR